MFGALKRGRFRSLASLILVVNVVGKLQQKITRAASRGFLAAARLSCNDCSENQLTKFRAVFKSANTGQLNVRFSIIFLTGQIAKTPDCPVKNRTPDNRTYTVCDYQLLGCGEKHVSSCIIIISITIMNTVIYIYIIILTLINQLYLYHWPAKLNIVTQS